MTDKKKLNQETYKLSFAPYDLQNDQYSPKIDQNSSFSAYCDLVAKKKKLISKIRNFEQPQRDFIEPCQNEETTPINSLFYNDLLPIKKHSSKTTEKLTDFQNI